MSDGGVFAVHRGVFDHPIFAPEPYTEREAWLWMISAAVWKAMKVRAGRKVIPLVRGQLVFSERFLAEKWRWAKTSVRRFLNRLKSESMIDTLADRDATLITICNYEKYAFDGTTRGPSTGPQNGPLADHSRTKEEETNNLRKEDSCPVAKATRTAVTYSDEFETSFWKPFPRTAIMSKKEAWREWMKLDPVQRLAACQAIEPYRRHLRQNPTLQAVHACRFLSQNRAEGILEIAAEKPKFDVRAHLV